MCHNTGDLMTVEAKSELRVDKQENTIVLTLDRPERGNTLTAPLVAAVADAIEEAVSQNARNIVLTGTPPAFCRGGDLTYLTGVADHGAHAVTDMIYQHFHRLVRTLTEAPIPVIAAINGAALGAGLDLAAICDFRLASSDATFASTWINVGLIPGMGGATWLTRLIGGTRAAQLVLTGQVIDAATAEQWNLVNDVVEPDQLLTRSLQMAAHLSSLPPNALARSKAALRRAVTGGVESELDIVGAIQGGLLTGAEAANHAARFGRSDGEINHSTSSRNRC
jgi:2-(1,2-epoxy-1,2-dihydrophenyl)acetyl-CoA isomerase